MPEITITPDQKEVLYCTARNIFVAAGRRWGKSEGLAKPAIIWRGTSIPNIRIMYVTPVQAQLEDMFESIALNEDLSPWIAKARVRPYRIKFISGTIVDFRSFKVARNIRGKFYHYIVVDESQDIAESDFDVILRATLSDKTLKLPSPPWPDNKETRGQMLMLGQFRGYDWRYERYFKPGQNPANWNDVRSWRFPSSSGIAFKGESGKQELDSVKREIGKIKYEQEYECIPTANEFSAFTPDDLQRIKNGHTLSAGAPGKTYLVSLDLGRSRNPTACNVFELSTKTVVYSETFPIGMEHEHQAQRASSICSRFNNALAIIDVTGGATGGHAPVDSHIQFYRKYISRIKEFHWNVSNKANIIQHMTLEMERGQFHVPEVHKDAHTQMQMYECRYKNGIYRYSAPGDKLDDHVASIAQGLWAIEKKWVVENGLSASYGVY